MCIITGCPFKKINRFVCLFVFFFKLITFVLYSKKGMLSTNKFYTKRNQKLFDNIAFRAFRINVECVENFEKRILQPSPLKSKNVKSI